MASKPLLELTIKGYDSFKNQISTLDKDDSKKPLVVMFTGNKNENGESWCPDCVVLEKTLAEFKDKYSPEGCLVRVEVGARDYWKNKDCPFRTDAKLKLSSIPTLIVWGTPKRLSDDSVNNLDNLSLLFEED